jgi:hypothetical protein
MAMAKTVDLVRAHREEYEAAEAPRTVMVGPARHVALGGKGEPGGPEFRADVAAVVAVVEAVRRTTRARGHEFKVGLLEALSWPPRRPGGPFAWKLLVRVPGFVTAREVHEAAAAVAHRGKAAAVHARLETLEEGECLQTRHRGAPGDVPLAVLRLEAAAAAAGRTLAPPVHEIYLREPAGGARAGTIVRQPLAAGPARPAGPRGRDRLPGTIRTTRLERSPQHRARELR